jgi:hypothetical protein
MKTECFKDREVTLFQNGVDSFTVVYGKQIKKGLTYATAAEELGSCLMHQAACEGTLDNRTRQEARRERRDRISPSEETYETRQDDLGESFD